MYLLPYTFSFEKDRTIFHLSHLKSRTAPINTWHDPSFIFKASQNTEDSKTQIITALKSKERLCPEKKCTNMSGVKRNQVPVPHITARNQSPSLLSTPLHHCIGCQVLACYCTLPFCFKSLSSSPPTCRRCLCNRKSNHRTPTEHWNQWCTLWSCSSGQVVMDFLLFL